jgi:hypothetical protein
MKLRFVVLAAAISFATLAVSSESDIAVISQYVVRHKHWPAKSFRIERAECDCAFALYRIIYLPEDGKLPAPNSKSFAVHYDEHLHKVIKETPFQ